LTTTTLVPPHDLKAEQALLGAMLVNPDAIGVVSDMVVARDFYKDINGSIFESILGAWTSNTGSADTVTISAKFPDDGGYIHTLAESCPVATNATHYAGIVKATATQRDLIRAGHEIVELGYKTSDEPGILLDAAEARVYRLRPNVASDTESLKSVAATIIDECIEKKAPDTVSTGFAALDEQTTGMYNGNLMLIGARPGIGKTSLALNIARNVASEGTVAFFSLEMSKAELTERILCAIANVSLTCVRSRNLGHEQTSRLMKSHDVFSALDMEIIDNPSLTLLSLKSRARQLAARKRVRLIVVDYLQLLTHGSRQESRFVEVSSISRELKALARELHCPVLALSQLNRESESPLGDGKPKLSQLRESGSLEQDADTVLLLSQPQEEGGAKTISVHVAKNRHGRTGSVDLLWLPSFCRLENF